MWGRWGAICLNILYLDSYREGGRVLYYQGKEGKFWKIRGVQHGLPQKRGLYGH